MLTKGIVLKSKRIGDRLRQLTVYSDKLGRVNLIAKVKPSEFPLKYEPFSVTEFKLLQKGDSWEIKESKLLKENFPKGNEEFFFKSKICKLIFPYEVGADERLFKLLETYLSQKNRFHVTYVAFLAKFLFLEGIFPEIFRCVKCRSREIGWFSVEAGGTVCKKCKDNNDMNWNREVSRELRKITVEPLNETKKHSFKHLSRIEKTLEKHLIFRFNS